jgi:hypothetical protein
MHQQPPKIPLCFSTNRANAGQVSGESGFVVSATIDTGVTRYREGSGNIFGNWEAPYVKARLQVAAPQSVVHAPHILTD